MTTNQPTDLETIRLIDLRQNQLLEDLDQLNQRIVDIIEAHGANRNEAEAPDSDQLDPAA